MTTDNDFDEAVETYYAKFATSVGSSDHLTDEDELALAEMLAILLDDLTYSRIVACCKVTNIKFGDVVSIALNRTNWKRQAWIMNRADEQVALSEAQDLLDQTDTEESSGITTGIRYPDITVRLSGENDDALHLIGICRRVMSRERLPKAEQDRFLDEVTSALGVVEVLDVIREWFHVEIE
ncbi:MAG: hypothetical protein OXK79_09705 [Chloroflexota bacterium]|nr:hypothetical protein [Chloroflexota bacterium]